MKFIKISTLILLFVICSYVSLWFGFAKGYEYKLGDNLTESLMIVSTLDKIHSAKTDEAIELLEITLDLNIVTREVIDQNIIKYMFGLPTLDDESIDNLESKIIKYRESSDYQCTSERSVCDVINGFLNVKE